MAVLTRPRLQQRRQQTPAADSHAAGSSIVGSPRCYAQPAAEEPLAAASDSPARQANVVSSLEKTADEISQDPLRYRRLQDLTHNTQSERGQVFLNLANEFREQRWIELERIRVGGARRPLLSAYQGRRQAPPPSTDDREATPKKRARKGSQRETVATLQALRQSLADEEDTAPLLPPLGAGEDESD